MFVAAEEDGHRHHLLGLEKVRARAELMQAERAGAFTRGGTARPRDRGPHRQRIRRYGGLRGLFSNGSSVTGGARDAIACLPISNAAPSIFSGRCTTSRAAGFAAVANRPQPDNGTIGQLGLMSRICRRETHHTRPQTTGSLSLNLQLFRVHSSEWF